MKWKSRRLPILLSLALAFAGMPAHACSEHEAERSPEAPATTMGADTGCPHHRGPVPEPASTDDRDESAHDCCGFSCRCGCSAPAPVLVMNATPDSVSDLAENTLPPHTLALTGATEQLLRPPKATP